MSSQTRDASTTVHSGPSTGANSIEDNFTMGTMEGFTLPREQVTGPSCRINIRNKALWRRHRAGEFTYEEYLEKRRQPISTGEIRFTLVFATHRLAGSELIRMLSSE